jgi:hypothetical protein
MSASSGWKLEVKSATAKSVAIGENWSSRHKMIVAPRKQSNDVALNRLRSFW